MLTTLENNLPRSSPEQQGVAAAAILEFVHALEEQIHELHSFMLLRRGRVIAEGWWEPYKRDYPHMLFSLSKSFTATAVGLAISEGCFSIDDPVLPFFPDEGLIEANGFLVKMRVRHLLTMSTGHAVDTWTYMNERSDGDWIKGFFEVPILYEPGTHFLYNSGATYMLAAIVQKTTGMKLVDYLQPRLFMPLGIQNITWQESPQGIAAGGVGLSAKTEDIVRFGQLYLQKGMWQGVQLLPEAWVMEATAYQISNGEAGPSDWTQGYGYQFWRCRHGAYRGDGVFGQYCVVMPEQEAVLAITGGMDVFDMQRPLDLLWDILLPAMGREPLSEDTESQQRLTEKLAGLSLPSVQGQATSSISAQIATRTYKFDANELGIETMILSFTEAGGTVRIKTASGEEMLLWGYGTWQYGQTALFENLWLSGRIPIVASGAWTAEDRFTMVVRLYETPFFYTLIFHFAEDEMLIETKVNASLDAMTPLLLTAHSV